MKQCKQSFDSYECREHDGQKKLCISNACAWDEGTQQCRQGSQNFDCRVHDNDREACGNEGYLFPTLKAIPLKYSPPHNYNGVLEVCPTGANLPNCRNSTLSKLEGTFSLTVGGYHSRQLPFNSSDRAVEDALEDIPVVGDVIVRRDTVHGKFERGIYQPIEGFRWKVEFVERGDNIDPIIIETSNLHTSGELSTSVTELRNNSGSCCISGTFRLAFDSLDTPLPGHAFVLKGSPQVRTSIDTRPYLTRGSTIRIEGVLYTIQEVGLFDANIFTLDRFYENRFASWWDACVS